MILTINVTVSVKDKARLDKYLTKVIGIANYATIELYLAAICTDQCKNFVNSMTQTDGSTLQNAFDAATPGVQGQVNTLLGTT